MTMFLFGILIGSFTILIVKFKRKLKENFCFLLKYNLDVYCYYVGLCIKT